MKESAGEENPNGLIFAKEKTEAVEKMGSFFFFEMFVLGRSGEFFFFIYFWVEVYY